MKSHPIIGAETLREVDRQHPGNSLIRMGIDIAESHHEKWNGTGYPYGLKETEIPLVARILALGDVYDALTSKRCYKEAFSHERSRAILQENAGSHFDPAVIDAFLATENEFQRIREYYQESE
jgi:putative two-component system response regulator